MVEGEGGRRPNIKCRLGRKQLEVGNRGLRKKEDAQNPGKNLTKLKEERGYTPHSPRGTTKQEAWAGGDRLRVGRNRT